MHSSRTMLLTLFLAILSLTHARLIKVRSKSCEKIAPNLPLTGNPTDLPTTNLTLSYIALGRGIQNYTCTAPSVASVAIGAIATLYDVTSLAYTPSNLALLHTLPALTVYAPVPAAETNLRLAAGSYKVLGNHYFDALGTPTFNLSAVKKLLFGSKTADVKPPTDANPGPAGTGAVDWLQLAAKANYDPSVGVKLVYRVVTAGGVAPLCTETGVISVQYAAEYWFYN